MAPRRTLTALVATLALAAPSAALAQSAGDEQYADPFGGSQGSNGGSNGGSSGTNGTSGTTAPATPAPTTPATGTSTSATTSTTPATSATPATPATATAAASSGRQLPYTGAPVELVGLAGVLMMGGGLALRVRLRERDD